MRLKLRAKPQVETENEQKNWTKKKQRQQQQHAHKRCSQAVYVLTCFSFLIPGIACYDALMTLPGPEWQPKNSASRQENIKKRDKVRYGVSRATPDVDEDDDDATWKLEH